MKKVLRCVAAVCLLITTISVSDKLVAQTVPTVDIGLFASNDTLEVRVIADANFNEVVSNLVFTIRWDTASGANLGEIDQVFPEIAYIPMAKSDSERVDGPFVYQTFAGFGFTPLSTFGASWPAGQEVVIMRVPVENGNGTFCIVNDAFTGSVSVNGDYFISLNGQNATDTIYNACAPICAPGNLTGAVTHETCPGAMDGAIDITFTGGSAPLTYSWMSGGMQVDTAENLDSIGAGTYHLTVTDFTGCTYTDSFVVQQSDTTAPTAVCQDATLALDGSGSATLTTGDIDNGSSDNCGTVILSLSSTNFSCSDQGSTIVTLTATDLAGNSSACTATVTIEDNTPPVALCNDITVSLYASGSVTVTTTDIDNGSSDNCEITLDSLDVGSFVCSDIGTHTYNYYVWDATGAADSCTGTITVEDNSAPAVNCPADVTVTCTESTMPADVGMPTVVDNCSHTMQYCDNTAIADGVCTQSLTIERTWMVTDEGGNMGTCVHVISVVDTMPPMITAQPTDLQIECSGAGDTALINNWLDANGNALAVDACNIGPDSSFSIAFDFEGEVATPSATNGNVTAGAMMASANLGTITYPAGNASADAISANGWTNSDAYFEFAVTPAADNRATPQMLHFDERPSGTGPASWQVYIVTCDTMILVGMDTTVANTFTSQMLTLPPLSPYFGEFSIRFVGMGASSSAGTWRLDNVSLTGVTNTKGEGGVMWSNDYTGLNATCGGASVTTVTFTAMDNCGNASTASATITVTDTTAPAITCPTDVVANTDAGTCAAVLTIAQPSGSDVCSNVSFENDFNTSANASGTYPQGMTTVTWTATDDCGNAASCMMTVTVNDTEAPTAVCQDITVQLDANGNASITTGDVDNGSSDNCGSVILSVTPQSFNCNGVGANIATLMVMDPNGNSDACTATVSVDEDIAPVAVCQDITVELDISGNASITTGDVENGSTDNCNIAGYSISPTSFDCSDVGNNNVVLSVTDDNGNIGTCNSTATVEDNIGTTAICQDITIQLDAAGNASITTDDIDNGSNDACGIAAMTVSPRNFRCDDVGVDTVILRTIDVNGNNAFCTAEVEIQDNIPPIAICQSITIQLNGSGNATISTTDVDNGSNDVCGIANYNVSPSAFNCNNVGVNVATLIVSDEGGNSSSCLAGVTVEDITAPTASCMDATINLNANGTATITATDIDNGSADACGVANSSVSPTGFDCSDIGTAPVTLTVMDPSGNSGICTANVTIADITPPTALCQDVTVQLDSAGNATVSTSDVDAGSSDACGVASITVDGGGQAMLMCSQTSNILTLQVTDNNGLQANCTSTVTVEDPISPTAICQDVTLDLDSMGNVSLAATAVDDGSSDNCAGLMLSVVPNTFSCNDIGQNMVMLTAMDVYQNESVCTAHVMIRDIISPEAICQDFTLELDNAGNGTLAASDVNNASNDECGIANMMVMPSSFGCQDVGAQLVTLSAVDNGGNQGSCQASVEVQDVTPPVAVCQDVTVMLDSTGNASITSADVDNGSGDECATSTFTVDNGTTVALGCSDVGTIQVTLRVTAGALESSCISNVTVVDNIFPIAVCKDVTLSLNAAGGAQLSASAVDDGSQDGCGIAQLTVSQSSFSCADIGANILTLMAMDNSGNMSVGCMATVTVEDNLNPTAICQSVSVMLDGAGMAAVSTGDIDNGSFDNCNVNSLSLSQESFSCSDLGTNLVSLTATDDDGNTGSCLAVIEVQDSMAPNAQCTGTTVMLSANGNGTITASDIDGGSSDVCGIASLSASPMSFGCNDIGSNSVVLTVTDNAGNISTCASTITVIDNQSPVAVCNDITVQLDGSGSGTITTGDVDGGSSDACGISAYQLSVSVVSCADVPSQTTVLTVTDVNNNISTCQAAITVQDNVMPTALCMDATVNLDAGGMASITTATVNNGSGDNCNFTMSVQPQTFGCGDLGSNIVTLSLTDASGNNSMCTANVMVTDNIHPTAVCQDVTTSLDAAGNATLTANDFDNGSSDNCQMVSLNASQTNFGCSDVGANNVVLTVTDNAGNMSTCASTVTVSDNHSPVAVCNDITVQLDGSGNGTITTNDVDGGSSDACGISSYHLSVEMVSCSDVPSQSTVLTVTDVNGNISTCESAITVQDNMMPAALCMDMTVNLDAGGMASITTATVDNGSGDNCSFAMMVQPQTFGCGDLGSNIATLSVTDASGNNSMCTADVTVMDNIAPVAVCRDVTTLLNTGGSTSVTANTYNDGSSDNCQVASLNASQTSFGCGDAGSNIVSLTVTDGAGNTDICTSNVLVQDVTAPTASCMDATVTIDAGGTGSLTSGDIDAGSTDACNIAAYQIQPSTFSCMMVGNHIVNLTVTDVNGNSSGCTANVNVVDMMAPTADCQDITAHLDMNGNASISAGDIDGGSNDNCGFMLAASATSFTCADIGANAVVLTAMDNSNNVSTCEAQVVVEDNVAPMALCQDVEVLLDAGGNGSISTSDIDDGSSDACGIATMSVVPSSFTCADAGTVIVTLFVTDNSGNAADCEATVTVTDEAPPTAVCNDLTVQLDHNGTASITSSDVDGGSNDACGAISSYEVIPSSFDCSNIGNHTVIMLVDDVSGNGSHCTSVVTVVDDMSPMALCNDITVHLDANGEAGVNAADINNGSTDNCSINSLTGNATYTCTDVGSHIVMLTATDNSGNISTCAANVVVEDNIAPMAVCMDITIYLDHSGDAMITASDVDGGSSDACSIQSMMVMPETFSCADLGSQIVTMTATDINGNQGECTANVEVLDTIPPMAVCQDITITLDNSGDAMITAADIDGGSWDACPSSNSISQTDFSCVDVGANLVTLWITDGSGNSDECIATVTVESQGVSGLADCPSDITVVGNASTCESIVTWTVPSAIGACGVDTIFSTHASGSAFSGGQTTVVYTAINDDDTLTCSFNVTVLDMTNPVISNCPTDINNHCTNVVIWPAPTATDNCGNVTLTSTHASAFAFPTGVTTVTYTATDGDNNSVTCSFDVSVSPLPSADAGGDVIICFGDSVQIGGSPTGTGGTGFSYNYMWFTTTSGATNPDAVANPWVTPSASLTNYGVMVTDPNTGCVATDLVSVTLTSSPVVGVQVKDHTKVSIDSGFATTPAFIKKDAFARSLAMVPDLNGDGIPEMVAGAYLDDTGEKAAGAIYVLFMNADGSVVSQQKIANGVGGLPVTNLEKNDYFGYSVAYIGDIDSDGQPEIAVGAARDELVGGTKDLGSVRIMTLAADGTATLRTTITENAFGFFPTTPMIKKDWFGAAVAGVGDVNGDGIPDLAVGASLDNELDRDAGAVYILFLRPNGFVDDHVKILGNTPLFTAIDGGVEKRDYFGSSLAAADLNGDGINDLLVGAPTDDVIERDQGSVWAMFLDATGTPTTVSRISAAEGVANLDRGDEFGTSVANLGDVNSDGVPDIAVGAIGDDNDNNDAGAIHAFFMNAEATIATQNEISGTEGNFHGILDRKDQFGISIAASGDLDGDCITEVMVGALLDDQDIAPSRPVKDVGAMWTLFLEEAVAPVREQGSQKGNDLAAVPQLSSPESLKADVMTTAVGPKIQVYPNPSDGVYQLSFEMEQSAKVVVEIYTLMGKKVADFETTAQQFVTEFDLSDREAGQYILKIKSGGFEHSEVISLIK